MRLIRTPTATLTAIARDLAAFAGEPLHTLGVDEARDRLNARRNARPTSSSAPVAITLGETPAFARKIALRIYTPPDAASDAVIVYCHGGGFVMGQPADFDEACCALAVRTRTRVVSVDYRLAPEHPFPAALDDVVATLTAVADVRIGVVGESAGGALALAAALLDRDRHRKRISAMMLFYPLTSIAYRVASPRRDSPLLRNADIEWVWRHYLGHPQARQSYAAPGDLADLSALPPTLLLHGTRDPVSPSVARLARRMEACGSPVEEWRCIGLPHVFTLFRKLPTVATILNEAADWLVEKLREPEAEHPI